MIVTHHYLLLQIAGHYSVWCRDECKTHNSYTKLCENFSAGSKVEMGKIQTEWDLMGLFSFLKNGSIFRTIFIPVCNPITYPAPKQ